MSNNPLCIHLCTQYTQLSHALGPTPGWKVAESIPPTIGPQWDVFYSDGYAGQGGGGHVVVDNNAEIVMQQGGVVRNEKQYPFLTRPKSKAICL